MWNHLRLSTTVATPQSSDLVSSIFHLMSSTLVVDSSNSLLIIMDTEFLQLLLKNDELWEKFVEEIELSSEEGEVLREGLKKHKRLIAMEDKEMHQWEKNRYAVFFFLFALFLFCFYNYCTLANTFIIVLICMFWMYSYYAPPSEYILLRERILKVFPEVKVKLGKRITQLKELADRADQVHKACTIANVGANTAGLVSGVMSLAGLCLAPVTGGLSVELSYIAQGVGAVATAASVSSSIVEQTNMTSIEAKANGMKTVGISPEELTIGVLRQNANRLSSFYNNFTNLRKVWGHVLAAENSPPTRNWLQRLFGSNAKTMTTKDKIFGGAATGIFVLMDAYFLLQASKQLKAGVKLEPAERMRHWSQELERIGDRVTQIHGSLLKSLTLPE